MSIADKWLQRFFVKFLVGAFDKEKALVGAFSGNCKTLGGLVDSPSIY